MLKKAFALCLLLTFLLSLFGCSHAIVYDEEKDVHNWLTERTKGYTQIPNSSRMVLYEVEDHFAAKITTGSNGAPRLIIENQMTYVTATENSILSVTTPSSAFGMGTNEPKVFDPYRNTYTASMKAYQKGDNQFRVFFWIYGAPTDFYPIPQLLTEEQYNKMLKIVGDYTEAQKIVSEQQDTEPVNYLGDFMSIYSNGYFSDKARNPSGEIFYQYNGAQSQYLSTYRNLFGKMGMSEQDWRKSYEELGYTGHHPQLLIVYFDMTVNEKTVDITLMKSDTYRSGSLALKNPNFIYAFCPGFETHEFITITAE